MDAKQQWVNYINGGHTFDTHYSISGMQSSFRKDGVAEAFGTPTGITAVTTGALMFAEQAEYANYFGYPLPNDAVISISQYGLHLPRIPLIKWEDIVAISDLGLSTSIHRASNANLITEDLGSRSPLEEYSSIIIMIRNANLVKSTVTPKPETSMRSLTTNSGKDWAEVPVILDPALGPEQIVEFYIVLSALADSHAIPRHHFNGISGGFAGMAKSKEYIANN